MHLKTKSQSVVDINQWGFLSFVKHFITTIDFFILNFLIMGRKDDPKYENNSISM